MASIEHFKMYTAERGSSPVSVFRQLVSNGGIKFNFGVMSLELKERDLQRVHDIIDELDDRRAFYSALGDKTPEEVVESVRSAKHEINEIRKGIWANLWAREVVQLI